ncbi:hypothetical protein NPIL_28311 [Nephila pilipes]|uniref:Uncharacterized protein n=1 Tax=Nephila pilipes TaxID=299642 RepID=A0A8X6URD5_NEPPI|nr:hypothetical protein NPIL_28311 [Nephila pilipes]
MFYTSLEGYNIDSLVGPLPTGAPFLDWKLDKMSKTERVKLTKQVYAFSRFVQVMFLFCLMWLLYFVVSQVFHTIYIH